MAFCGSRLLAVLLTVAGLVTPATAQRDMAFPAATTLEALTTYPGFYHQRQVVVRGEAKVDDRGQVRLVPAGGVGRGVWLMVPDERPPEGPVEVRGLFWDVGRFEPADHQVTALGLGAWVNARVGDRWPAHGEMPVIYVGNVTDTSPPTSTPTIRQLALAPDRYEGQRVTLAGQFGGRNLFGDVAQSPRVGRWDFVLRAAGGAVWVTGIEPKGRGWRLDPDARIDTGQWLEVSGTVRTSNGLVWIEAASIERTTEQEQEAPPPPLPPPAPAPPPEVIFSVPVDDDTNVPPATQVRIQTSRDLDPATLEGRVRVSYVGQAPDAAGIPFTARFDRSNRVLYLTFQQPFERYRTVQVELGEGILGTDGKPLEPFTLTFTTGG